MRTKIAAKAFGVAAVAALALCLSACGQTGGASSSAAGSSSSASSSQAESSAPAAESSSQTAGSAEENAASVSSVVSLGTYPRDGGSPIQWVVLDVDQDKVLLLAQDCVDSLPWDSSRSGATWDGSSLRAWLNGDFLSEAFTDAEQQAIVSAELSNGDDLGYGTPVGASTEDKVFLLSGDEVNKYLPDQAQRTAKPTAYAASRGAYSNGSGDCAWWLRSPGMTETSPAYIASSGDVGNRAHEEDETIIGVRPAIWVSVDYLQSQAGA